MATALGHLHGFLLLLIYIKSIESDAEELVLGNTYAILAALNVDQTVKYIQLLPQIHETSCPSVERTVRQQR